MVFKKDLINSRALCKNFLLFGNNNETCAASILQENLDVFDRDNDGKVTLEEYLGMLRETFF